MPNVTTSSASTATTPAVNSTQHATPPPASETLPNAETKKRHGAKSSLSDSQVEIIQSFFPEMEKLLVEHKLHAGKENEKATDPHEVASWFEQTVSKIL